jgi:hypothetical protein
VRKAGRESSSYLIEKMFGIWAFGEKLFPPCRRAVYEDILQEAALFLGYRTNLGERIPADMGQGLQPDGLIRF